MILSKWTLVLTSLLVFSAYTSFGQSNSDTKSHVSSDKMFIINYPATWKENKTEMANAEFCINAPGVGFLGVCMVKVEVNKKAEGYENADIHKISEVELKMLKAQSEKQMNLQILESSFKKLNAHEWWFIHGKATQGNKVYFTDSYKTIHSNKVYVFTYFSNEKNYEKNKSDFEKIFTSVEFLTNNETTANAAKKPSINHTENKVNSDDDRVSNSIPIIADKPLWSVKNAIGWIKNKEGQWISGKNKIQSISMSTSDEANWSKGINAVGLDNFISIEVRDVKIGKQSFIVLIKIMADGDRQYESSPSSWKPVNRVKYYVVQRNETTPTVKDGAFVYDMKIYFVGYTMYDKSYLHNIALKISEVDNKDPEFKTNGTTARISFNYKELSDGKKCRFMFDSGSYGVFDTPFAPISQYKEFVYPGYFFPDYYYECTKAI